jgi:hypothetical protein
MNKTILLTIASLFLHSCTPHVTHNEIKRFAPGILKITKIINERYHTLDGAFSVRAPSQPDCIKFSEQSLGCGIAIIFESLIGGITTRYDIYPINDFKMLIQLGLDIDYQKAFLRAFFFDNIFSLYEENQLEFKLVSDEFIIKDECIYYFAILNGQVGTLSTLLAIKDSTLVVIYLDSLSQCIENLDATKQEKSITSINLFHDFKIE